MNIVKPIIISDINDSRLDVYARLKEVQLARIYEPAPGLFIAESPLVILRALARGYIPESVLISCEDLKHTDSKKPTGIDIAALSTDVQSVFSLIDAVPVYSACEDVLSKITGFRLTRGMLCAMKRQPQEDPGRLLLNAGLKCASAGHFSGKSRIAVLEDVVNPTNVGAIFRSAAALDIDCILLTHSCADPLQRRSLRVSMGNVFLIPWSYVPAETDFMQLLHSFGYASAAMALTEDSVSIDDADLKSEDRLALILGSEGPGLKESTIASSDYVVRIPMTRGADSLNVAAAAAVAFWEINH